MTEMTRKSAPGSTTLRRLAGGAIVALLMGGCAGTTTATGGSNLGDYQAAPRDLIGVSTFATSHVVHLSRGGKIGEAERKKLDAFIAHASRNRPESLRIVLHGRASSAQTRGLENLLMANGINPEHIVRAPHRPIDPPVRGGTIVVEVERAIAIIPNCPGATGHPTAPEDTLTEPNFGCANVANLAAMVADPHHLIRGASSIYYTGERGAADVAAYRTDKVKALPKVNESSFSVRQ